MGRPLTGTEPRQTITLRLAPTTIALLDNKRGTVHRSTYIEQLLLADTGCYALTPQEVAPGLIATVNEAGESDPASCPHPPDQRRRFQWGSQCEQCGKFNP